MDQPTGHPLPWEFKIDEMDCAEEVAILKRTVGPLVGGEEHLSFDLLNRKMTVRMTSSLETPQEVVQAVAQTGMQARIWSAESDQSSAQLARQRRGRVRLTAISCLLTVVGWGLHWALSGSLAEAWGHAGAHAEAVTPFVVRICYSLAILAGVWYVLPRAWYSLKSFSPDMNLLMTLAVVGAVIISQWLEAATVSALFSLSLVLESWNVGRARRAISALLDWVPPTVRLAESHDSSQCNDRNHRQQHHACYAPAESVQVGERFVVTAGERFALDGVVVRGDGYVNQAPITGESVPVEKSPGEEVFAGTINGESTLEVECTRLADQSVMSHIVRLVTEAQSRRAPIERWVEWFARIYTPLVFAAALAVFLIPPLFLAADWYDWFYRSLVLLVISCPCALVISTPVAIVAGLTSAARQGVLIKGGQFLERPALLKALAFDKTGTLTFGKPTVVDVIACGEAQADEIVRLAASIETGSRHPLAKAILDYSEARQIRPITVEDVNSAGGLGVTARWEDRECWIGSTRLLDARGLLTADLREQLDELTQQGRTVVAVGQGDEVLGLICMADSPRPQAEAIVQQLHNLGIERLILLTGDNQPTADRIAGELGIDEVRANLLPDEKVAAVEELVTEHRYVAMIGDGVNDAPAMARSSLAIAMGDVGSDVAIETADIALMADDLSRIPWLIEHSRRTMRLIRQNITVALGIKLLFVVLMLIGHASLWGAVAADMGASFVVIFNALRLLGRSAA